MTCLQLFINGLNAAMVGSTGSHGNTVTSGSGTIIIGDSHTPAPFTPPLPLSIQKAFGKSFSISDSQTGKPLALREFVATVDGAQTTGMTDANGIAHVKSTSANSKISLHVKFNKFDDIGYHYGIACDGTVLEGRDIRLLASSVKRFNTGVIGIVLLENLTTAEEGGDIVAKGRETLEFMGYSTTNVVPAAQVDALMHLIEALKSVFVIERFGGHREFPGQDRDGKICPGNIGMELVRNIRTKTQLLPPPKPVAE